MARVMGRISSGVAFAAIGLLARSAAAEPLVAEPCEESPYTCAVAPLVFEEIDALPIEWSFDTGWVPPGSPLQVHIQSLVAAHTKIRLEGSLFTDWLVPGEPGRLVFDAPGTPGGGLLSYHYGFLFLAEAKVQIDVVGVSINWQGAIPYVPQVDIQVLDDVEFDAWGWDPGVSSTQKTDPQTVAQVDMTSLFGVNIPGLESGFQLDVAVELEVGWVNDRIVVERVVPTPLGLVEGGPITGPGIKTYDPAVSGPFAEVDVHPEGRAKYDGTLHLIPSLYVKALGNTWSIPIADIPLPFLDTEVPWSFEPERVHVPLPDFQVIDEDVDFGEVSVGQYRYLGHALRSKGEAPAHVQFVASDPEAFQAVDDVLTIGPATDVIAALKFVPQHEGLHEGELVLYSNDPDTPVQVVNLRGIGLASLDEVPPPQAAVIAEGGCGCRTTPARGSSFGWLFVGLGAIALRRAASRRSPA
jgi:MYXO-CTERM domain-containing protein